MSCDGCGQWGGTGAGLCFTDAPAAARKRPASSRKPSRPCLATDSLELMATSPACVCWLVRAAWAGPTALCGSVAGCATRVQNMAFCFQRYDVTKEGAAGECGLTLLECSLGTDLWCRSAVHADGPTRQSLTWVSEVPLKFS